MRLGVALAALLALAPVARAGDPVPLATIDRALGRATRFLVAAQADDGAWRSDTYASLRDGPALTPYVMSALWFLPQGGKAGRIAFRKGVDHLATCVGEDGRLRVPTGELIYPAYTAAMASRVVVLESRNARNRAARRAWLTRLRAHRLGGALGWTRADPAFGGWGYAMVEPRKPRPGEPAGSFSSNLSATLFGLAALRSAEVPDVDLAWAEALAFVTRCQNHPAKDEKADGRFDDGGFFFAPGDDLGNKAGVAGKDEKGRTRYRSYGAMTADGVRALLLCGLPPTHPRVVAARGWLEKHFRADGHPGRYAEARAGWRDATYYYWAWSLSHAFARLDVRKIGRGSTSVDWARDLAYELLRRQREDGSWRNGFTAAKEDDPLVATPWAASALAICRAVMAGGPLRRTEDYPTLGRR